MSTQQQSSSSSSSINVARSSAASSTLSVNTNESSQQNFGSSYDPAPLPLPLRSLSPNTGGSASYSNQGMSSVRSLETSGSQVSLGSFDSKGSRHSAASNIAGTQKKFLEWASSMRCQRVDSRNSSKIPVEFQRVFQTMDNLVEEERTEVALFVLRLGQEESISMCRDDPYLKNILQDVRAITVNQASSSYQERDASKFLTVNTYIKKLLRAKKAKESDWQGKVWEEALERVADVSEGTVTEWESGTNLKLPNAFFAGAKLPPVFHGTSQRPDFLWPTHHSIQGQDWSVGEEEGLWCDCVGEGKPEPIPDPKTNDHALNQVIMSASACLYLQIFTGKSDPHVLAFTLNQEKMRFFVASGLEEEEDGKTLWKIEYYHVEDRDLDLSIIGECIHAHTLAKALRMRKDEILGELSELRCRKEQEEQPKTKTIWWVSKEKRSRSSVDDPPRPSNRSKTDHGGGNDPGSSSGGGGKGSSGGGAEGGSRDGEDRRGGTGGQGGSEGQGRSGGSGSDTRQQDSWGGGWKGKNKITNNGFAKVIKDFGRISLSSIKKNIF